MYNKNLLPDDLKKKLLKAKEESTEALAHYVSPITGWGWYAVSLRMVDENTPIFFGYVQGDFDEWGEFDMEILEAMNAYLAKDGKQIEL